MKELEYCWLCDAPTGNAGRYEDSLYDTEEGGPYCEECWDKITPYLRGEIK